MRDADKTVDKLLAGLRTAEPSAGLERRILQKIEDTMEARPSIATDSAWRRMLPLWRLRPMSIALAALLVVCIFVATSTRRHQHPPSEVTSSSHTTTAPQISEPTAMAHQTPIVTPLHMSARVSLKRPRAPEEKQTEAASQPAPPLPLTEQEKLLLRLTHQRDAQDIAILNRDKQTAQAAKATEQFQQFFAIKPAEMRSEIE